MTQYSSKLMRVMHERGYIHQTTDASTLDDLAQKSIISGYIGFDATAPSLHVGNLVSIMLLRRLQQAGHKPIVLMGGGTTRIGDPTGRDESRKMLTDATIEANIASIRTAFEKFLVFGDGPTDAVMVNNHDWLGKLGYIEMLQKVGTHFTVNRMLTFDSVKLRLDREQPMTFLEFNYMILQGYDYRHLNQNMGVRLQLGGSDQWGNIINGVELTRRMDGQEVFGLTTPLITKADGSKMGKSVSGAVWLNEAQLSHYDYWQFWRNVDDRDVGKFMRLFTDIPLDEIAAYETLQGSAINDAKVQLANAATTLCRGAGAAQLAEATAASTFQSGIAQGDLPTVTVESDGISLIDALNALGFVASNKEARRKIDEGAVRVSGDVIRDPHYRIAAPAGKDTVAVQLGSKRHGLVKLS